MFSSGGCLPGLKWSNDLISVLMIPSLSNLQPSGMPVTKRQSLIAVERSKVRDPLCCLVEGSWILNGIIPSFRLVHIYRFYFTGSLPGVNIEMTSSVC